MSQSAHCRTERCGQVAVAAEVSSAFSHANSPHKSGRPSTSGSSDAFVPSSFCIAEVRIMRTLASPLHALSCSLPLRSTLLHDERYTDVRLWPCRSGQPQVVLLFICGNPGLIDYYNEFLSSLYAANADRYEVIGVGHEGHSPDRPLSFLEALQRPDVLRTRPMPSLREQVVRKIAYVDEIRATYPDEVKLVLIGHSVGAYICQEIVKARSGDIEAVYGLFPTVADIAISPNGLRLSPLFQPSAITLVTTFLTILTVFIPFGLLHAIVRLVTGQRGDASQVTARLVANPSCVSAALAMAGDEMATICELDYEFHHRFGSKLTYYFAAGSTDGWVGSKERVAKLAAALDSGKDLKHDTRQRWYICEKGMPHAFCLEHSAVMSRLCAEWIADDLKQAKRD